MRKSRQGKVRPEVVDALVDIMFGPLTDRQLIMLGKLTLQQIAGEDLTPEEQRCLEKLSVRSRSFSEAIGMIADARFRRTLFSNRK